MHVLQKILALSIASLWLSTAVAAPEAFTIDPKHTYPMFETSHFGISVQRGRFDKSSGKIVLDRQAKSGSIDVSIDAESLNMGFDDWNKHMKSKDFFDTGKFPTIAFKSSKLVFDGDKLVGADGQFTLHGVTKPLQLKVSNFACTQHPMLKKLYCGAEVSATIKRSDFGMSVGIPAVSDDIHLIASVEAIKD